MFDARTTNWWMDLQPYEPEQIQRLYELTRAAQWEAEMRALGDLCGNLLAFARSAPAGSTWLWNFQSVVSVRSHSASVGVGGRMPNLTYMLAYDDLAAGVPWCLQIRARRCRRS